MSYQYREHITINSQLYETQSEPLKNFEKEIRQKYVVRKGLLTSLWRDYVGTWEVDFGRLFLTGIKIPVVDGAGSLKEVSLEPLFGTDDRIFAYWFSGKITIKKGRVLMSYFYENIHERDCYYIFTKGIMTDYYEVDNTKKKWEPEPF
ncbi:hypothetical protein [Chryseobacterium sp.]|uniref:hypothetical protein n=1 Tax=Chryseobacterium sp. TaxID=1871047 RepID=UPI0012A8A609|nr:hypothetical protein [Chryseobacterium sp.]QFG52035.1 hypothetical protein F7R58_00100 [Chryseobacterium sp.]